MYSLSKKYNVELDKLISMNPQITNPDALNIGDKVKIPTAPVATQPTKPIVHEHKVQQGDTLWKLSKAWEVSLKDIIDANPQLKNPNALLVGEVVYIPGTVASNTPSNAANPQMPSVSGETNAKKKNTAVKEEMEEPEKIDTDIANKSNEEYEENEENEKLETEHNEPWKEEKAKEKAKENMAKVEAKETKKSQPMPELPKMPDLQQVASELFKKQPEPTAYQPQSMAPAQKSNINPQLSPLSQPDYNNSNIQPMYQPASKGKQQAAPWGEQPEALEHPYMSYQLPAYEAYSPAYPEGKSSMGMGGSPYMGSNSTIGTNVSMASNPIFPGIGAGDENSYILPTANENMQPIANMGYQENMNMQPIANMGYQENMNMPYGYSPEHTNAPLADAHTWSPSSPAAESSYPCPPGYMWPMQPWGHPAQYPSHYGGHPFSPMPWGHGEYPVPYYNQPQGYLNTESTSYSPLGEHANKKADVQGTNANILPYPPYNCGCRSEDGPNEDSRSTAPHKKQKKSTTKSSGKASISSARSSSKKKSTAGSVTKSRRTTKGSSRKNPWLQG